MRSLLTSSLFLSKNSVYEVESIGLTLIPGVGLTLIPGAAVGVAASKAMTDPLLRRVEG